MKAHKLFTLIAPQRSHSILLWIRQNERELYANTLASLANQAKLRPVFIQKKSAADQITWIVKKLQQKNANLLAEHTLQVYFMQAQQDLLLDFCQGMHIPHSKTGEIEGALPETLDADKLQQTAQTLFSKYPTDLVTLYFYTFNLQQPGGWDSLDALLQDQKTCHFDWQEAPATP